LDRTGQLPLVRQRHLSVAQGERAIGDGLHETCTRAAFAVGLLILLTQFTIAAQFAAKGQPPPNLGDGYETDLVLNAAASELIADAAFECVALLAWRVVRCKSPIPPDDDRTW